MKKFYQMKEHHTCHNTYDETLYKIGLFASMNHITVKALRYYDEQGLLKPAYIDEENNYRYYKLSQMSHLHQIMALRNMDFSIEEIKKIIEGESEKELLMKKKREILQKIAQLTAKLSQIESYLAEEEATTGKHVLIKKIPKVTVAAMEKTVATYDALFDIMPQMAAEMERLGCECALPEYCFTNYLDEGYKEEEIRIQSCEAVTKKQADSELIKFIEFEAVKAACIFHQGSYETLPMSYRIVLKFIEENGYEIAGNIRESYIDGIWNKESKEDWLTEIQIPVKK